jgi:hypothetical protein
MVTRRIRPRREGTAVIDSGQGPEYIQAGKSLFTINNAFFGRSVIGELSRMPPPTAKFPS